MSWEQIYINFSKNNENKEIERGIKDWKRRGNLLSKWLKNINKKVKILDCGCSIGVSGMILKKNGFRNIIGIDSSRKVLNFSKKVYKNRYVMNCEKLKFKNRTFDVVIALNIIEHLKNPKKFIKEIKRILNKDGLIIFSLPNTTLIRHILKKNIIIPEHLNYWNLTSFKKFMSENGLKTVKVKAIGEIPLLPLSNTMMILAKVKK